MPRKNRNTEEQPESETTTQVEAPTPPSAGPVELLEQTASEATTAEGSSEAPAGGEQPPVETIDTTTGEVLDEDATEEEEEDERSTLEILQDGVRELFDYDQLQEIRHSLNDRREALSKHQKKGLELGVIEEDAHRRIRLLDGDSTRFGLIRIFAAIPATEQRDVFFNRDKPSGRPGRAEESKPEEPTTPEASATEAEVENADAAPQAEETRTAVDGADDALVIDRGDESEPLGDGGSEPELAGAGAEA